MTSVEAAERHPLLQGYPVAIRIPVQWGEMDAYGHVNNATFFRYFESARMEYLARCRFLETYENDRVGAILHSTDARFRRPLFHPDTILVGATARDLAEDRFTMLYRVVSLAQNAVVADGSGVIVSFDYGERRKTGLPARVREAIQRLEDERS